MSSDELATARRRAQVAYRRGLLSEAEFAFITRCEAELAISEAEPDHLRIKLCLRNPTNGPIGIDDLPVWAADVKATAWYYIGVRKEGAAECVPSTAVSNGGPSARMGMMKSPRIEPDNEVCVELTGLVIGHSLTLGNGRSLEIQPGAAYLLQYGFACVQSNVVRWVAP